MKKLFVVLIFAMLITTTAFADLPDFSSMSFDELQTMKTALDKEYNSRPESEGMTLMSGEYHIGRDIKPGLYYIAMVLPSSSYGLDFSLYENAETLSQEESGYHKLAKDYRYMELGSDPVSLNLESNNVLIVSGGPALLKASVFDPTDYYTYEPPAGTLVPEGSYIVGKEIPAGKYVIYPGTIKGGRYNAYCMITNEDGTTTKKTRNKNNWGAAIDVSVYDPLEGDAIELFDGDTIEIGRSVIMQKAQTLSFD